MDRSNDGDDDDDDDDDDGYGPNKNYNSLANAIKRHADPRVIFSFLLLQQ